MNRHLAREFDTWFVTAPAISSALDGDPYNGITHAKAVGTLFTACGLNAFSWHMAWELRFPAPGFDACPDCSDVLEAISELAERANRVTTGLGSPRRTPPKQPSLVTSRR